GGAGKLMDFDSSNSDQALKVNVDVISGEYVLKLTIVKTDNVTAEHTKTSGILLSQAALLRELGEKLQPKIRARI
ncbi:hypothetical protein A2U01_0012126, partial [Trifolium medium]|nr:hypothetical protein [Trifolium medium]